MNRREFLMSIAATLVPKIIRVNIPTPIQTRIPIETSPGVFSSVYTAGVEGRKSYLLMHYKTAQVYKELLRKYGELPSKL